MKGTMRLPAASPVKGDAVGRSIKSTGLLEKSTSQAMQRRFKLDDALGKLQGKK